MGFRKPALTKEFKVFSTSDPCVKALDTEKYLETLDAQYLEVSPGAAEFVLVPLTTRQKMEGWPDGDRRTIKAAYESCEHLVRCSLRRVDGFDVGGKPLVIKIEDGMVSEESIGQLQDEGLIFELAGYVRQISHLP